MKDIGVWIVQVSSYNDKGWLHQLRKVLMTPAVFGVLKSIVLKTLEDLKVSFDICCVNERTASGDDYIAKIIESEGYAIKLVLISAKTFEFSRATDVANELKRAGIEVVIGGSGVTLTDWKTDDMLIKEGTVFNIGEGEEMIPLIIADALSSVLKPFYWQRDYIDLRKAPLPAIPDSAKIIRRFAINPMVGIDGCRGCPHNCSFCCVTVLCGRKMIEKRSRDPEAVIEWVEQVFGIGLGIMLLDDNFRRSPVYNELLDKLIALNERLKNKLYLFVQLDASPDVVKEIPRLAMAGVKGVFLGIETTDQTILGGVNKKHNNPAEYKEIVRQFRKYGILVTVGWMVAFPSQTPEGIIKDARIISRLFDLASLFRVVPLPGSLDYRKAVENKKILSWDPNDYDATHLVQSLYKMSVEEAKKVCDKAFYINHSLRNIMSSALNLRWRSFKDRIYCRLIAEWGRLSTGRPFNFIMDGPPRLWGPIVPRPPDSFKGFPLTLDDLEKRELFLESHLV